MLFSKTGFTKKKKRRFFGADDRLQIVSSRFLVLPSVKKKARKSVDLEMKIACLAGKNGDLRYEK